jgi:hypothetical protein
MRRHKTITQSHFNERWDDDRASENERLHTSPEEIACYNGVCHDSHYAF